jgi:hypothetical protein
VDNTCEVDTFIHPNIVQSQNNGIIMSTFRRDGVGVTAPVLSDGSATYTPGVSVVCPREMKSL